MSTKGFIQTQAEAYESAKVDRLPWMAYGLEVLMQWEEIGYVGGILLCTSAITYLSQHELYMDVQQQKPIKTWANGRFDYQHPMTERRGKFTLYQLSRALHDYQAHYHRGYLFSPMDELSAALDTREDFSLLAQAAQWTDDVAMGCYYAHFGKWPEVQHPVIVEPDWEGLKGYLCLS